MDLVIPSSHLALMLGIILRSGLGTVEDLPLDDIKDYPRITLLDDDDPWFDSHCGHYCTHHQKPAHSWIAMLVKYSEQADVFLNWKEEDNRLWRFIAMEVLSHRADSVSLRREPERAKALWLKAAAVYVHAPVPTKGARPTAYAGVGNGWELCAVLQCYLKAAICSMERSDYIEAFKWLEEFYVLDRTARFSTPRPKRLWDWEPPYARNEELYLNVASFRSLLGSVFLALNNTGSASFWLWYSYFLVSGDDYHLKSSGRIQEYKSTAFRKSLQLTDFLHPEPKLMDRMTLKEPSLQVLGSWKKITPSSGKNLPSRFGSATFVHKGYLYVLGGDKTKTQSEDDPHFRDFWRIELSTCRKWERLPDYPNANLNILLLYEFGVDAERDKAYYFVGSPIMDVFNLRTLRWEGRVTTYFHEIAEKGVDAWPWGWERLVQMTSIRNFGSKMYVFGGDTQATELGNNIFMEFDFRTLEWKLLSGDAGWSKKPPEYTVPGPRTDPSTWIDSKGKRFYVMSGVANRLGAMFNKEPELGGLKSHPYFDIWSWDLVNGGWREERMEGNPPCPRTEMAAVYNPFTDHVAVFGGYCPTTRCASTEQVGIDTLYSFFADTFIAKIDRDPSDSTVSLHWKQVLSRGFPTYRASPKLVVDDTTGKIYLFSGYVNTQYVPQNKGDGRSRSFGDLWELRVDLPGSGWDQADIDLEDEARTAALGPWQKCYACGAFGNWKKCGGFFKGLATVVFISAEMNVFEMDGKNIKPPMTVGKSDTCSSKSIYW